jgi:4-hydroxybenzoate polyprenyltransferase
MNRLQQYFRLIRLDKPIGILLLLWPTLWALWMASNGKPDWTLVAIFTLGTVLMRSAGCAINDYAVLVALVLALISFALIWPLNTLTKQLSIAAVIIAATYPYFKRFFAIPQAYLGIAFGFGIPMSFAAVQNTVPAAAWWLLVANIFWAVAYDTEYAMVDREDDLKLGMKTSAITFGSYDVAIVMLCYAVNLGIIAVIGWQFGLRIWFVAGLLVAVVCAVYHYTLIRDRGRAGCFAAFRHNNWLGAAIFGGVALDYLLR